MTMQIKMTLLLRILFKKNRKIFVLGRHELLIQEEKISFFK